MMSLFNPPFDIFTIAGGFVLGLCTVEIILFLLGASLSKLFNSDLSADVDHDVDVHLDFDHDVNLFHMGDVPFIVTLLSFGFFFSLTGIALHLLSSALGFSLSNLIVIPASIFSSSFFTYWVTHFWHKHLPNEETYSVKSEELLGNKGIVVLGKADFDNTVEVSTKDKHGTTHYLMTKCALKELSFQQGDTVVLVEKYGDGAFGAIPEVATKEINN